MMFKRLYSSLKFSSSNSYGRKNSSKYSMPHSVTFLFSICMSAYVEYNNHALCHPLITGESTTEEIINSNDFSVIIVGGGTAGCTTAYFLAKWMDENNIPGNVLLIDKGVEFASKNGPNTKISAWYENWCEFAETHETSYGISGNPYPVSASDHKGLGGCSTHDTRITFQLAEDQYERIAGEMGWSVHQLKSYYQTALNLMPMSPAIKNDEPVEFYNAVIGNLTTNNLPLHRIPDDEHKTEIVVNSIAQSSLAMYSQDELRWCAAYLMHKNIRPTKLKIVTDSVVDKILFDVSNNEVIATGVNIVAKDKVLTVNLNDTRSGSIVVTCGSIGNSAVLQRSGIGPKDHLMDLEIPVIVNNPYVGHGVDHEEIAVMYEWLDKWNENDGSLPKGGVMGWPLVLFGTFLPDKIDIFGETYLPRLSKYYEAHFGAGYAEPYTSYPSVVITPSCIRPDHSSLETGFKVLIKSKDPNGSCIIAEGDHHRDLETMAQGVYAVTHLMNDLVTKKVVGKQLEPPFEVNVENKFKLLEWIKENHFTVYHWACTTQSGIHGRVADEYFRVRTSDKNVIPNLRVGSAAALPELSEANPHLTVTAFAIALAEEVAKYTNNCAGPIVEISNAREQIISNDKIVIRRVGEEKPALLNHATMHYREYHQSENK